MSMFQVLTQKGWVDVMHYTMLHSIQDVAPFVAIYFIVYHLAINLVCITSFNIICLPVVCLALIVLNENNMERTRCFHD